MDPKAKNKLRDQLVDLGRIGSGQISQKQLERIHDVAASIVTSVAGSIEDPINKKLKEVQDRTHKGFKLVAEDVAEIGARAAQLSNEVVRLQDKVDKLTDQLNVLKRKTTQ